MMKPEGMQVIPLMILNILYYDALDLENGRRYIQGCIILKNGCIHVYYHIGIMNLYIIHKAIWTCILSKHA